MPHRRLTVGSLGILASTQQGDGSPEVPAPPSRSLGSNSKGHMWTWSQSGEKASQAGGL